MDIGMITLFIFLVGLFFGSFLLVVADRSSRNKSFLFGRSQCEYCQHHLSWKELIPLFSYAIQRGKCRHCHTKLSLLYPLSELLTGIVFVITFFTFNLASPLTLVAALIVVSCLLIIVFADLLYEIIPLPAVILATLITLIHLTILFPSLLVPHVLAGLGSSLFFLVIFLVTKGRGMGFGDVIYAAFMGLLLGYPAVIIGLYLSFVSGALISLVLIILKKKKLHGGTIPFGPFLVLGTFIMMIWQDEIVRLLAAYVGIS